MTMHLKTIVRPLLYASAILLAAYTIQLLYDQNDGKPYTTEFRAFGTYGRLTFWADTKTARQAGDDIRKEMRRLHNMLNLFDKNSELARLNRNAYHRPVKCTPELWAVLETARQAYRLSGAAFDISIGALMDVWGFHQSRNSYPKPRDIERALEACGLDKVQFDDQARTVRFTHPDTYLDFGGLAKGYALDRAVDIAGEYGITAGLIDLGGNVFCLSQPPPGRETYKIGLRNPFQPDSILQTVPVLGCAVATSGNYENYYFKNGKMVHHILDPRTGYPVERTASVTVISPRGWLSDFYSTAIFVKGEKLAGEVCREKSTTSVLLIRGRRSDDPEVRGWRWPTNTDLITERLTPVP